MAKRVGIDLGTSNSCVSYVDGRGIVRILDNSEGEQTTPSVVFFEKNGRAVIGKSARSAGALEPDRVAERAKEHIGDADYCFEVNNREYSAAAISSLIIKKLVEDAEAALGEEIEGAVITCPAYFGDGAKYATRVAGENVTLSGGRSLNVLRILDETTASAIAYCDAIHTDVSKTALIYDLGGGTFDCTVMKIDVRGEEKKRQAITTGGEHGLGGKDWDAALEKIIRAKLCESMQVDAEYLSEDPEYSEWICENLEKIKKMLTTKDMAVITVDCEEGRCVVDVTRAEFEEATQHLLARTVHIIDDMLEKRGLDAERDIDEIILVGGASRMPQIKRALTEKYKKPITPFELDRAVALGAAIVAESYSAQKEAALAFGAAALHSSEMKATDSILSKSYGIRIVSGGEYKVLNLLYKDTPKPAKGDSKSAGIELRLSNNYGYVSEAPILVLENTSRETLVPISECDPVFVEEPIRFGGSVFGKNKVSIEIAVDIDGIVTLSLKDLDVSHSFKMRPTRKLDSVIDLGMEEAQSITLA